MTVPQIRGKLPRRGGGSALEAGRRKLRSQRPPPGAPSSFATTLNLCQERQALISLNRELFRRTELAPMPRITEPGDNGNESVGREASIIASATHSLLPMICVIQVIDYMAG